MASLLEQHRVERRLQVEPPKRELGPRVMHRDASRGPRCFRPQDGRDFAVGRDAHDTAATGRGGVHGPVGIDGQASQLRVLRATVAVGV